jgi:predicted O-methyltransferase YrrM
MGSMLDDPPHRRRIIDCLSCSAQFLMTYRDRTFIPDLVHQATEGAVRAGFELSCTPETGRLLATLTAGIRHGRVGEIGTGVGVGAAWIASALSPTATFTTVEVDDSRAAIARRLVADRPNIHVLTGDWHVILAHGPFDLLFVDTPAKRDEPEQVLNALALGGMAVLDDLTPEDQWPAEWRGQPDPVREFWLNDPRLLATEIMVSASMAVILAARIGVSRQPRRC